MRRSRCEILSRILEICQEGAFKTQIVYQANLNFRTVNIYLDQLMEKGMIEVVSGPKTLYRTTEEGRRLMTDLARLGTDLGDDRSACRDSRG